MSREWSHFIAALESKNVCFSDIQYASDRGRVIEAAGFTDPFAVAVIETEWRRRCEGSALGPLQTSSGDAPDPSPLPPPPPPLSHPSSSSHSDPTHRSTPAAGLPTGTPPPTEALHSPLSPTRLAALPAPLQDRLVASAVLSAALGVSGALFQCPTSSSSSSFSAAAAASTFSSTSLGGGGMGGGGGLMVSSAVPLPLRDWAASIVPMADAYAALRRLSEAEYLGRGLVAMALGETVGEICASYARQLTKLQRWSEGSPMPLMGVVSEVLRVGHHLVRLRQVLPAELLLPTSQGGGGEKTLARPRLGGGGLTGARILNHLTEHAERCAGSQEDAEILQLLLRRALAPYLRILHQWMREGVLEDPYAEFFITEVDEAPRSAPTASSAQLQQSVMQLFPEASSNMDLLMLAANGSKGDGALPPRSTARQDVVSFERRFSMNKLLIPTFIEKPSRIPKMIFFAGKYCCLLRESNHARPTFDDPAVDMLEWSGADFLHAKIQESFEIASGAMIQMFFSSSVDFMGHLSSLKFYFLQERSDWVVDFLENAEDLLMKPPDKVKIHSLRVLLQSAIARGGAAASDPYHSSISCSFADSVLKDCLQEKSEKKAPPHGSAGIPNVEHCIHLLQLEADLQWPLTLVLDAHMIERFNHIFRLFIWMKTCERMLASLWYTNEALSSFAAAYGIKHQLTQFLRQFLFYAAHFVVEPLWSRMVSRILQTDSVFSITNALNDFFEGVELGLAMSSPQRFSRLSHILDLCRRFCELGVYSSSTTAPLIEATLHAIEDDFLRTLSELAAPIGSDYTQLVPLLTWIDFSGFYGRNNIYHILRGSSHGT